MRHPRSAPPPRQPAAVASTDPPTRSAQRREALDVLSLARDLCALTATQLARLPLDDALREQIAHAQSITSHIAHKRELQYLAKHMRERDLAPLRAAMTLEQDARRRGSALHKLLERWRDRLIEEGDGALAEFLDRHPQADRQGLRQCLQKARRMDDPRQPAAARELFRRLREAHTGTASADIHVNSTDENQS